MSWRFAPWLFVGLLLGPSPVWAQQADLPEIVGVRVGLAGRYKAGVWTPVRVALHAGNRAASGQLVLTVPDGDGVPSRVSTLLREPCAIPAGESREFELCVRFGRVKGTLNVEFRSGDGVTVQRLFSAGDAVDADHFLPAVPSHREIVLTVAADKVGVEEAFNLLHLPSRDQAVVVRLEDLGPLPSEWYGYEGVDAVVICASQPQIEAGLDAASPQVAALEQWIRMGGKLVLSVGQQGDKVLRAGSPLARLAPGRFHKTVALPHTSALETYCGSSIPVPHAATGGRNELFVPQLVDVDGAKEAREGDLPLVIRRARGFGQVVFLAADLDRAPLRDWSERGLLVGRLLDHPSAAAETVDESRAILHFGYTDLAGQLRSALDQFSSAGFVAFWIVIALVAAYVVVVGPIDFLLLRKLGRRMELTWVTFPLIVFAFGIGTYFLAREFKGNQVRVNQIDLVDVDEATGQIRGTTWANFFSPRTDRYDLAFRPNLPGGKAARDAAVLTTWLGLSGSALGGMDPATVDPKTWREHYDFGDRLELLRGVPISVWSTKSLTARWTATSDVRLQTDLVEEDRLPGGTITNTLDFPLTDCVLAYGRWAYELGTLKPGQSARIGTMSRRRELETLLTGRKLDTGAPADKFRFDPTPLYDQASVDPAYVLRAMIFFQAAGGRRYTGFFNRYQGFADLSGLLKTNRAILVGRAEAGARAPHGAELLCDGQPAAAADDQHMTFYRFVIPVNAAKGG